MLNIIFQQQKEDNLYNHNWQTERKQTTAINIDFSEDTRKQLEKFSLNFSSCNLFPSWRSAAKDTSALKSSVNKSC